MIRSLAIIPAFAIALALPAAAEELSEQDAKKIVNAWNDQWYAAAHKKDAAAIANFVYRRCSASSARWNF
jgi:hypothetical protein